MINRALILLLTGVAGLSIFISCKSNPDQSESEVRAVVPVTVTSPRIGKMVEYTELMATSAFLVKAVVKSPIAGYIEKCLVSAGDRVVKNQLLFQLRTKEATALQQDSLVSLNFSGIVMMKASMNGVVATIDHPQGDYVLEGDALATLVVPGSMVFLLDVPFELKSRIRAGQSCKLVLPDNSQVNATVKSILPSMSGASQTQRVVLQPLTGIDIPENLVAKVSIVRNAKAGAVILPKSCILNDEIMKNFWVLKLVSDSIAIKIPVELGIRSADSIEVASPVFGAGDRILSGGNWGLGDTTTVRIIHHE